MQKDKVDDGVSKQLRQQPWALGGSFAELRELFINQHSDIRKQ